MNITEAVFNRLYEITDCHLDAELKERMYALGLLPGQQLLVIRKGIGGDPIQIRIGATEIMLRKNIAEHINITEAADSL